MAAVLASHRRSDESLRVNVVVVYESLTGNTKRAAEAIGAELDRRGVTVAVFPVTDIDYQALAVADLVVMGSWVDGLFVVGQKPGRGFRLETFPPIDGKRCVVFCTYALNPGKVLDKMTTIMEDRGAEVLGGMSIRRTRIDEGAIEFVDRTVANVLA